MIICPHAILDLWYNICTKFHSNPCKDVGGVEKTNVDGTEWRTKRTLHTPCHFMGGGGMKITVRFRSPVLGGYWIDMMAHKTWCRLCFSHVLSISSHIHASESSSDPRLFKYTWIMHFMEYKFSQDGQNSWHMRTFFAPKCIIFAHFSYPKIIYRRNFTTISIIFYKTLARCISSEV